MPLLKLNDNIELSLVQAVASWCAILPLPTTWEGKRSLSRCLHQFAFASSNRHFFLAPDGGKCEIWIEKTKFMEDSGRRLMAYGLGGSSHALGSVPKSCRAIAENFTFNPSYSHVFRLFSLYRQRNMRNMDR